MILVNSVIPEDGIDLTKGFFGNEKANRTSPVPFIRRIFPTTRADRRQSFFQATQKALARFKTDG